MKPRIVVRQTAIAETVDDAIHALVDQGIVRERGAQLVEVVRDPRPPRPGERTSPARTVKITAHRLTELAQLAGEWVELKPRMVDGVEEWEEHPVRPPTWAVQTIIDRQHWPFAPLEGVIETPFIQPDGTLVNRSGYDDETGYQLVLPEGLRVDVHPEAGLDDAEAAYGRLVELLSDFPFDGPAHVGTAIAAILTLIARPAIQGPVPIFVVTATTPGSGKSLLVDVIHAIGVGRTLQRTTYPPKEEELEKRITSVLMAAHSAAVWDNLDQPLGGAALDALTTSTLWMGRELGRSQMVTCANRTVWFATGNNVRLTGDIARRVAVVRMEPGVEHPEDRQDFRVPKILSYVGDNRADILRDCLTILVTFCRQGKPSPGPGFGSFEAWNDLVRGAVVWAGGTEADPVIAAKKFARETDENFAAFEGLASAWAATVGYHPVLLADVIEMASGNGSARGNLKTALEVVCGDRHGLNTHLLGNRLKKAAGRIFGGFRFESPAAKIHGAKQWQVVKVER